MANNPNISIRGNSVPAGGVTATVVDQSGIPLIPDTATAMAYSRAVASQGERNVTKQTILSLVPGQTTSQQLRNTGLGESIDLPFSGSISFVNSATSTQSISISPEFPFSLLSRVALQFNGQTNIIQASGYELLGMTAKRQRDFYVKRVGLTGTYAQAQTRISNVQASVTAGANVTLTTGDGLCGYSALVVAGSSTGVLNFKMNLRVHFTPRGDLLLGLLPIKRVA